MTKHPFESRETDAKPEPPSSTQLSRRELIIVAGQVASQLAVASALTGCEGKDTQGSGSDLGDADMRRSADMRNQDMRGVQDLANPDDLSIACMPKVATDAELLPVGEGKSYPNAQVPSKSFFVARDSQGFFALRNVCLHQGCQVDYNSVAKTYDCPCHGSRYNLDGTVLMGPTVAPLKSFPLIKRGDGLLEVDPCGPGSTDLSGRVT